MQPLCFAQFGLWESLAVIAVVLVLFLAKMIPELQRKQDEAERRESSSDMDEFILWLAQGFDLGRVPKAPGTLGSLAGVVLFLMLLSLGNLLLFISGLLVLAHLSVFICGRAEQLLGKRDPGSVVFDEIVAIPLCFLAWVLLATNQLGEVPSANYFFDNDRWLGVLAVFGAFRLFDIAKPWPVHQAQSLPGGWGVTADDLLAAGYVNLLTLVAWRLLM
ncbi:MAG: phosphatidylglycerophosphatase A [Verrucomicrobiota bacterium]